MLTTFYKRTIGRAFGTPMDPVVAKLQQTHLENSTDQHSNSKKRKRDDAERMESQHPTERRRRADSDTYTSVYGDVAYPGQKISQSNGRGGYGTTQVLYPDDRMLMPPPMLVQGSLDTGSSSKNSSLKFNGDRNRTTALMGASDFDAASRMSIKQRSSLEIVQADEYDMERARRHAAATTLPANSGVWERAERDLFFHLSLRGFEPILPKEWMKDFPTLPISLYHVDAHQGRPMIQVGVGKGKQFRAIRAFRELLDIGRDVRDKVISSPGTNAHIEDIIEKAVTKYFAWAFADVDLKVDGAAAKCRMTTSKRKQDQNWSSKRSSSLLPIHVVCKQRASQTTTECLVTLKRQMHQLAAQHREARGICSSIEYDPSASGNNNSGNDNISDSKSVDSSSESQLLDETTVLEESEDDLPVIYGLMICHSILVVFTLNSQAAPQHSTVQHPSYQPGTTSPAQLLSPATPSYANTDNHPPPPSQNENTAPDPRYISHFDFSDSSKDVWNTLVVVIVVLQVRRDLLAVRGCSDANSNVNRDGDGIEEEEKSDPDA